mmetsp:Transcript_35588/g.102337  ORF Transcript_35588/g.102337 Transcript_35588/m.102337 type:complete len:368 (-) Transcript_35588:348-1451(-)
MDSGAWHRSDNVTERPSSGAIRELGDVGLRAPPLAGQGAEGGGSPRAPGPPSPFASLSADRVSAARASAAALAASAVRVGFAAARAAREAGGGGGARGRRHADAVGGLDCRLKGGRRHPRQPRPPHELPHACRPRQLDPGGGRLEVRPLAGDGPALRTTGLRPRRWRQRVHRRVHHGLAIPGRVPAIRVRPVAGHGRDRHARGLRPRRRRRRVRRGPAAPGRVPADRAAGRLPRLQPQAPSQDGGGGGGWESCLRGNILCVRFKGAGIVSGCRPAGRLIRATGTSTRTIRSASFASGGRGGSSRRGPFASLAAGGLRGRPGARGCLAPPRGTAAAGPGAERGGCGSHCNSRVAAEPFRRLTGEGWAS